MNTPAHIAASLWLWRNEERSWPSAIAVAGGAMIPDLPMFGFYVYQKIVGSTEREIWNHLYFEEGWQLFFDIFNSIPLAIVLIFFFRKRSPILALFAASALLHMVCDLPVHHDDAHRHFLPLSNWRFESAVSYWDPAHYGMMVAPMEALLATVASAFVAFRGKGWPMRSIAGLNLVFCVVITLAVFAFLVGSSS